MLHAPTIIDPAPQQANHDSISGLLAALDRVSDPRKPRGVCHRLVTVLAIAVIAALAGVKN